MPSIHWQCSEPPSQRDPCTGRVRFRLALRKMHSQASMRRLTMHSLSCVGAALQPSKGRDDTSDNYLLVWVVWGSVVSKLAATSVGPHPSQLHSRTWSTMSTRYEAPR